MNQTPRIIVLYGGVGAERDVSLRSGECMARALQANFEVEALLLDSEAVPESLQAETQIIFPALHGRFGEDGQLQALLAAKGVHYCGSNAAASRLCMDKVATKAIAQDLSLAVPAGIAFNAGERPLADAVIEQLGTSLVLKPADQGSSVGLHFTEHRSALGVALSAIRAGNWLIEECIRGREVTVGVLQGTALAVVEIVSRTGVYDYAAKYTPGWSEYHCPAKIDSTVVAQLKAQAEQIFAACGCRDFARVDFLLDGACPYFLEINTLPGLTDSSLLPKSALGAGYDFEQMAAELVAPAIRRFQTGNIS